MQETLLGHTLQDDKEGWYFVYFGLGIGVKLKKSTKVFQVSEAGEFFGKYLLKNITDEEKQGRVLEIGTGSGALAILAKAIGCQDVTATDIDESFINIARLNSEWNETMEYKINNSSVCSAKIKFVVSDLFNSSFFLDKTEEAQKWNLIFFNPPGWQTPKDSNLKLRLKIDSGSLYHTMFDGEKLTLMFLQQARKYLKYRGRILIGLNSMVGIGSILCKYRKWEKEQNIPPLQFSLKDQKEIKLSLYHEIWEENRELIVSEIQKWNRNDQYLFKEKDDDFFWNYDIVEAKFPE